MSDELDDSSYMYKYTYLLVQYPDLHPCVPSILFQYTTQRPPL